MLRKSGRCAAFLFNIIVENFQMIVFSEAFLENNRKIVLRVSNFNTDKDLFSCSFKEFYLLCICDKPKKCSSI